MDHPLVSFLVSSYNKSHWLADCLWSIYCQTYRPLEIVICDNGSTDTSRDIISAFLNTKELVPIFWDKPLGICGALNKCIQAAHGDWVIKLDADDICSPTHTEGMIETALSSDADMVYGDFDVWGGNGQRGEANTHIEPILNRCTIGLASSIIKKSVFDDVGLFDEDLHFSEDWEFIIRLIKAGKKLVKGPKTGYIYRQIDKNAMCAGGYTPRRLEGHTYIRKKHNLVGNCQCGCGAPGVPITLRLGGGGKRLSVSMIVKNEESVLGACLESIRGVDEIVVLDTGSTDRTPDVVKEFSNSTFNVDYIVGEYSWKDDFADARNESLKRCTGDWILIIDADEHLEEGGVQKIRNLLDIIPDNVSGVGFRTISDRGALLHESVRLFRNNAGIQWHGVVHNYLSVRAEYSSDITLYYGYSPAHSKDPDRSFRILTKEIEKNPEALRERFYLAREYFYRKNWQEAMTHYKLYLEKAHWAPEKAEAWMQVSRCFGNMGMSLEARLACLRALEVNVDFKDALNLMAQLSQEPEASKWKEYATLAKNTNTLFCSTR